ncbi:MAG: glycosyltransferase family 2 protein [Chloroflexota bacterium]
MTQTYNEAPIIADMVGQLLQVGEANTSKLELVVVLYEGAADGTNEIVRSLEARDARIRTVVQPRALAGYGRAFRQGIYAAQNEYVFQTDADGQFDFTELSRAATYVPQYDFIHFNRGHRNDSWERLVIGRCFSTLVRLAVHGPDVDFNSAFKLFRRDILHRFTLNCESGILVPEFVIKAHVSGARMFVDSTLHQARLSGRATWDVQPSWFPVTIPNGRIVGQNLRDLFVLRREILRYERSLRRTAVNPVVDVVKARSA